MDPKNIVVAIDLHGVLFKHDYKNMFKLFFKSKNKLKLIWALLNPYVIIDAIKLYRKNAVAEEYFITLGHKHKKLEPFISLGISIANEQRPVYPVINLLKHLKKQGVTLELFSNIGSIVLDDLIQKHKEIFALFDRFVIPSQANNYRRKPSDQAFLDYMKPHTHKTIILIDDKKKNIRSGVKYGMLSIFYENIDQLKRNLSLLNVPVA